jgi:hypothetical protein
MSEDSSPAPRARRLKGFLRLLFLAILLLVAVAIVIISVSRTNSLQRMTWLTPAEMAQAKSGGRIAVIKARFEWLIGPLRRFIHRGPKALLNVRTLIYTVSPSAAGKINPGTPASTNDNGMRAWILSPDSLSSFRQSLKAAPGVDMQSAPEVSTADGLRSVVTVGNFSIINGVSVPIGVNVDIIPRVSRGNLKILVSLTDTETNTTPPPFVRTNLDISCRASIPNGGALVIDAGNTATNHYWVLLTPQLIDAAGNPIKSSSSHP